MASDITYDEDEGGARHPSCFISAEVNGRYYLATISALPWAAPVNNRAKLPIIYLERCFRKAFVPDPAAFRLLTFLCNCLNVRTFLVPFLDLVLDDVLDNGDPNDDSDIVFANEAEVLQRFDPAVSAIAAARTHDVVVQSWEGALIKSGENLARLRSRMNVI